MSKKVSSAMFFVLLAGLIWSFGPLIVRNINNAELIPWQYSLIRGSVIFLILNIYLFLNEGKKFTNRPKATLTIQQNTRQGSTVKMMICNNSSFTGCSYEDFKLTKEVDLASDGVVKN